MHLACSDKFVGGMQVDSYHNLEHLHRKGIEIDESEVSNQIQRRALYFDRNEASFEESWKNTKKKTHIKETENVFEGKEEEEEVDDDKFRKQEAPKPRTATGGVINTLMIFLTILAFFGNAAFLIHVFWLKENITFQQEMPKAFLPFNNFGLGPLG